MPAEKFGKYTLLHRLAIGGMGEIWLARQSGPAGFDRFIAIKRLLPNLAESPEFVQMFQDEARLAARLAHPGICQVYEFDRIGNSYYLAMEYLHGETLASMLDRAARANRPLSQPVVAYIAAQALEGLHFAHEAKDAEGQSLNLIHRDISPSNIFVTYDGQVKLLDFGIAKAARRTTHTQAGSIKGKYGYIAPEVYRGQAIDRRVDLFSMGVVLWEMLTGRRLYNRGADYEILKAIVEETPPDPRDVNTAVAPALAQTALKALDKHASDRFQSALEMRRAVTVFLRGLPEEMDAQRMGTVMADLFGRIWIDLRSSVLDSFKDGMESVANAEALNPTLTDAQISELTQLAVASLNPRAPSSSSLILPQARHTPSLGMPIPTRPSSGVHAIPVTRPPSGGRSRLWLGSAAAVTALISVAAFATYQRRTVQSPPAEETAEPVPALNAPVPTEATAAMRLPPLQPIPEPGPQLATSAPLAPAQPLGAPHDKAAALLRGGRAPARTSAKLGGGGKVINPDQPMDPWKH